MAFFGLISLAVLTAAREERVRSRINSGKARLVVGSGILEKNARLSDTEGSGLTRFQRHVCRARAVARSCSQLAILSISRCFGTVCPGRLVRLWKSIAVGALLFSFF